MSSISNGVIRHFRKSDIFIFPPINDNLEQQAQTIFDDMFADAISNIDENDNATLGSLVQSIDNRGKTPPLSQSCLDFPIIDVRALAGNARILNFNNCTKFVNEQTYNEWFRNGHPMPLDILISTVGSLAEMKLFYGSTGCIAQNVVGFRSKKISPFYLYQYLQYIKSDLVSYNIGSVQPSIKVTHIMKHKILIPTNQKMQSFDKLARSFSEQIYKNCIEIDQLTQLRDTLLPRLVSGEIDVSQVEI